MDLIFICGIWTILCVVFVGICLFSAVWTLVRAFIRDVPAGSRLMGVLSAGILLAAAVVTAGAIDKGPNELSRVQQKMLQLEKARPAVMEILAQKEVSSDKDLNAINRYLSLYNDTLDVFAENQGSISGLLFRAVITPQYNIRLSDIQALAIPLDEISVLTQESRDKPVNF